MTPKLHIIIASTRPGRVGPAIARWFEGYAKGHGGFDVELVDLADFALPVYDEPQHPRLQNYQHEHTKRWSASVAAADAYVFVTPEYNYGMTPALLNALNYVYLEWNYKPAAFVSYGGLSGGVRGVEAAKHVMTTLKMAPLFDQVTIPGFPQFIDKETGVFTPNDLMLKSAKDTLDELKRWAVALKPMRG